MDAIRSPALGGAPRARAMGRFNARGTATFYVREMMRGFKIWKITLAAPAVRALLYISVFGLAIGGRGAEMGGMPFLEFIAPGLVAVAALERAFEASSFTIVFDKTEGIFTEIAMLPLTAGEIVAAYAAATVSASLIAAAVVWAVLLPFGVGMPVAPLTGLFFIAAGSLMVGLFGQIGGLWAGKWDHIISVQTFLFMPFVFLSGVFFSLEELSGSARTIAQFNPVFYVVDGIRYALSGRADADPWIGAAVVLAIDAVLCLVAYRLFARGYKYKS